MYRDQVRGECHFYRDTMLRLGAREGISASLNLIGSLHQQLGEYPQALDYYQRALKIAEEIGYRAGVASNLGEISLLYEKVDQPILAIPLMVQAFLMYAGMNMQEEKTSFSVLVRLKEKVGENAFQKVLGEMDLPANTHAKLLQALEKEDQKRSESRRGEKKPDRRQFLIQNTIAVMTQATEIKPGWCQALRYIEQELQEQNETDLATYVNALYRLMEGTKPEAIAPSIPEGFRQDWKAILDGISKKE